MKAGAIAEAAAQAVRDLWRQITDAVHADICARLQDWLARDEFRGWDAHWNEQVARFPAIDWVLHDWLPEPDALRQAQCSNTPPLFGGWVNHPLRHAVAWRDTIPQSHRESWHGGRNDAFAWPLHYSATDWKFAARKNARLFAQWPNLEPGVDSSPKDHLNGRDEVLGGGSRDVFWDAIRKAYGGADRGDFKGAQLYGAISVVKRLWPAAFLRDHLSWHHWKPDFESVQDVAATQSSVAAIAHAIESEPDELLAQSDRKYYAVLCMDGDDMGQWVAGNKTPLLERVLAEKAWQYFNHGRDGLGGWRLPSEPASDGLPADAASVRRPLSPSFHATLSEALSNFGLYCARQIVEGNCSPETKRFEGGFDGQLLYSGGDDVLAMVPASNALDCALALECAFRGELPEDAPQRVRDLLTALFKFLPEAPGFLICRHSGKDESVRPSWPLMVPGTETTASVGIAIGHVHSPMQDTIQAARDAEKTAKAIRGKGAFCLSILKRSGDAVQFASQWRHGVVGVWDELRSDVLNQTSRFAYRYLQLIRPLLASTAKGNDGGWERDWTEDLKQAVMAELRHVLKQQAGQDAASAQTNAGRWTDALIGDDLESPVLAPRGFVHFWMAWAFVNRLDQQPEADQ